MKFTEYCKQNDILLLKDDMKYLRKLLCNIPDEARRRVLKRYSDEWIKELRSSEITPQSMNLARRKANLALPGIIKEVMEKK